MRKLDKEAMFPKDNITGHKDNERQDHNTDTPFEFRHSEENNKGLTEAQVCYTHVVEEELNKQN